MKREILERFKWLRENCLKDLGATEWPADYESWLRGHIIYETEVKSWILNRTKLKTRICLVHQTGLEDWGALPEFTPDPEDKDFPAEIEIKPRWHYWTCPQCFDEACVYQMTLRDTWLAAGRIIPALEPHEDLDDYREYPVGCGWGLAPELHRSRINGEYLDQRRHKSNLLNSL